MNISELKNYLKDKSVQELSDEIITLFKQIEDVQDFYEIKLSTSSEVIEKYKKMIEKKIMPSSNFSDPGLHLGEAKKIISEFKKITTNKTDIADIMLFYVETGVKLTNTFGDIDEKFYESMEGMYEKTLKYIFKHNIEKIFYNRCMYIVENTSHIGWGFHDNLSDNFNDYFKDI